MAAAEKKRKTERLQPFVSPCRYVLGGQRFPGFLTDLSEHGGRVHTEDALPAVGATLTVEARLGRQATHVKLPATVRWGHPAPRGGFLFGVSFDGIGSEEQKVLDGVVAEFRRRAASID